LRIHPPFLLWKDLPPSPSKTFALKELYPCHPERSEGSEGGEDYLFNTIPTHGFFVILQLKDSSE
jgi:hypothetical protein